MPRSAAALCAVLVATGTGHAVALEAGPPGGGRPTAHRLVLTGVWTQPGCAPTRLDPDPATQSAAVDCEGLATYHGQLTGFARQRITGRATATTTTARIVADIYGRTHDNRCGSLHLDPERAVVTGTGATGQGPITRGTGDFAGARGWYDATGVGLGGVGEGGYRITLWFPKALPTPAERPCVPPAPRPVP